MINRPPFRIKIADSITAINKEEWDSIFPKIPENYNFFKTLEETLSEQFKLYYIAIYEGPQLLCVAPCFTMEYSLDTTIEGPLKMLLGWLKQKLPKLFTLRVFICGCPMSEGRIGLKDPTRGEVINVLLTEMFSLAKKANAPLLAFKDFSNDYLKIFKFFFQRGFHRMQSYPSTEITMHFKSFEEYLASLSRVTRKSMKKKFRQVDGTVKIEMQLVNDLGSSLDEVYKLYLNTLNKSEVQFEKLTKEFLQKISRNMPQEAKYFLWRIDGRLVAFDLCLIANGILIDEYIGLDYEVAYKYHLYYVTFRDVFRWCLENNIHSFQGGTLNYDPKKHLDFKFIPQHILVKHTNPFMNIIFGLLCIVLKPDNFDPTLKSLKKSVHKTNPFFLKVFALIFAADLAESIADVFFKKGTLATGITDVTLHNILGFMSHLLISPFLWIGISFYFINFLLWILALSKVDLSMAFPLGSATYVIVPLLSMIFLKEQVLLTQWLGVALIVSGVFLISKSTENKPSPQ